MQYLLRITELAERALFAVLGGASDPDPLIAHLQR
jgi:hypothetical protein